MFLKEKINLKFFFPFLILVIYKYYFLTKSQFLDFDLEIFFTGINNDYLFVIIFFILSIIPKTGIIQLMLLGLYILDLIIIRNLDSRVNLEFIIGLIPNISTVLSFLNPILILPPLFYIYFVKLNIGKRIYSSIFITLIVLYLVGMQFCRLAIFQDYKFINIFMYASSYFTKDTEYPLRFQEESYTKYLQTKKLSLPAGKPNIILLMVESLSLVDSKRGSGINNYLKRFDEITKDGMYFTNFLANYNITEGGTISILSGEPPVKFTKSDKIYINFKGEPSVISEFKKYGYFTELFTNSKLSYMGKGSYFKSIGFDIYNGTEEVESLINADKFTIDCPADEIFLNEFLNKYKNKKQPYFVTLLTISSHTPYEHPEGKENTKEEIFDYVDRQIEMFYKKLKEDQFFENGILIIVGDHRRLTAVLEPELQKMGTAAMARVPLVLIGKNIPKNIIDKRFFNQTELFSKFNDIFSFNKKLSDFSVYSTINSPDKITVFKYKDKFIADQVSLDNNSFINYNDLEVKEYLDRHRAKRQYMKKLLK